MPDLGQKHECFKCGTKFYDLKKSPVICPKCHADQKEAPPQPTSPQILTAARRAKRDEFADPDLFERGREEEEPGPVAPETEEALGKKIEEEEAELGLGEVPLQGSGSEDEDEY